MGFHVQDHVAEASTIILVAIRNKNLKMFLQMLGVGFLDFTFFVGVILGGVALDFFIRAFVA